MRRRWGAGLAKTNLSLLHVLHYALAHHYIHFHPNPSFFSNGCTRTGNKLHVISSMTLYLFGCSFLEMCYSTHSRCHVNADAPPPLLQLLLMETGCTRALWSVCVVRPHWPTAPGDPDLRFSFPGIIVPVQIVCEQSHEKMEAVSSITLRAAISKSLN